MCTYTVSISPDSNLCSVCKLQTESILHLFCFCPIVDHFWNDKVLWINRYFKRNVVVNNFNKLFGIGYPENNSVTKLINCFLLNARFLIYLHKFEKTKPTIGSFVQTFTILKSTKKYICVKNGKLKEHTVERNGIVQLKWKIAVVSFVFVCALRIILQTKKKLARVVHAF